MYWSDYRNNALYKTIIDLMKIRKQVGIQTSSKFRVVDATSGLYSAFVTGTKGELAIALGTTPWAPGGAFTLSFQGPGVSVWVNTK